MADGAGARQLVAAAAAGYPHGARQLVAAAAAGYPHAGAGGVWLVEVLPLL